MTRNLAYARSLMTAAERARFDAEWNEEDHPKGPDGKFIEAGGGGESSQKKEAPKGPKDKQALDDVMAFLNDVDEEGASPEDALDMFNSSGQDPLPDGDVEAAFAQLEFEGAIEKLPNGKYVSSLGVAGSGGSVPEAPAPNSKFIDSGEGLHVLTPKQKHEGKSNDPEFRAARAKYFANRVEKYRERIKNATNPADKAKHQKTLDLAMKQLERNVKAAQKFAKNSPNGQKAADAAKKLHAEILGGKSANALVKEAKNAALKEALNTSVPGAASSKSAKAQAEKEKQKKESASLAPQKYGVGPEMTTDQIKELGLQVHTGQKITDEGKHVIVYAISGAVYKVDKETKTWETLKAKPAPKPYEAPKKQEPKTEVQEQPEEGSEQHEKLKEHESAKLLSKDKFYSQRKHWEQNLTSSQKAAAHKYTGQSYIKINGALRQGKMPGGTLSKTVKDLDAMFDRPDMKTTEDMIVNRGMGSAGLKLYEGKGAGTIIVDDGYSSTTVNDTTSFGGAIDLKIHIPKGSRAAAVPSVNSSENEVLLPRGTGFEILKTEKVTGSYGSTKLVVHVRAHTNLGPKATSGSVGGDDEDGDDY